VLLLIYFFISYVLLKICLVVLISLHCILLKMCLVLISLHCILLKMCRVDFSSLHIIKNVSLISLHCILLKMCLVDFSSLTSKLWLLHQLFALVLLQTVVGWRFPRAVVRQLIEVYLHLTLITNNSNNMFKMLIYYNIQSILSIN